MLHELTILPGISKTGLKENFESITLCAGDTVSIVGPTGSGKTALITDIELLAQEDTITGRKILVNRQVPDDDLRDNPMMKPITMITQNTKCFADLTTDEFLRIHTRARGIKNSKIINDTIDLANKFTGEKIKKDYKVTALSGGQTRSLLVADAILIGSSPVILLDEVENAGIFRQEIVRTIQDTGKIIIFVTHDPLIALMTQKRIIMSNGAVKKVIFRSKSEVNAVEKLIEIDRRVGLIREKLRAGERITNELIAN